MRRLQFRAHPGAAAEDERGGGGEVSVAGGEVVGAGEVGFPVPLFLVEDSGDEVFGVPTFASSTRPGTTEVT